MMLAAQERYATPSDLQERSTDELIHDAWRDGQLRWVLRPHQRACYDHYRAWEKLDPAKQIGRYPRIFVLDIGKRWGKTSSRILTRFEDCRRRPRSSFRYTTAFQKDIEEIVEEVSQALLETCPDEYRPEYKIASKGRAAGFYFPDNGSVLKCAGLDKNPNALRGRASDGDDISEAAFVRHLRYTAKNVLYHQYQGKPHARMCLESSAPLDPDTEYDTEFVEDAKARNAYWYGTIDDNTALSEEEREEFIRAAGGREHDDCKREYFNQRVRSAERMIVPEFRADLHVVQASEKETAEEIALRTVPEYALTYVAVDPGVSDKLGMLHGYWDFVRQKLVIQRSWAESNANTAKVADTLLDTERELWLQEGAVLRHWTGKSIALPPYRRLSDVDKRLIIDMRELHGVSVQQTAKDEADAQVGALRIAFMRNQIEIWPDSGPLEAQLLAGKRKEGGRPSEWERSEVHGHFDCVAALVYLWRNVARNHNPFPPQEALAPADHVIDPAQKMQRDARLSRTSVGAAIGRAMGGGMKRKASVWR